MNAKNRFWRIFLIVPREPPGLGDATEVALYGRDAGALHCHVLFRAHRHALTERKPRLVTVEAAPGVSGVRAVGGWDAVPSSGDPLDQSDKIVRDVIVVGASAGGIHAVIELLSRLPADLPAFMGVVIHRGAATTSNWSSSLGRKTNLQVVEPNDGDSLTRGVVYIAPADCHMTFEHDSIALDGGAKEHHTRPAVDPLFTSAAVAYGPRVVGVVLTGGGYDGMQGLLNITTADGLSIVQKPSEAEHASMPEYAIARDHVRAVLTLEEIGDALLLLARGGAVPIDAKNLASIPEGSRV